MSEFGSIKPPSEALLEFAFRDQLPAPDSDHSNCVALEVASHSTAKRFRYACSERPASPSKVYLIENAHDVDGCSGRQFS
ncbi:hypothetical protein AAY85_05145 [Pseudomonas amygdali pv. lachrymans]|nr:hypothetical protein AAY85_05145 [Pseudomonas amygdali pv. lachrymans]